MTLAERMVVAQRSSCSDETDSSYLSRENSHRGSSGRSNSGIGMSCAELRRVVIRTRGALEFMEELESEDTYRKKGYWLIMAVWDIRLGY